METVLARRFVSLVLAGGLVLGAAMTAAAQVEVDAGLSQYERTSGVSGNLNSIGSDTLNNLMTLWAEAFRTIYPNVNIQIEGKGSSTVPPALIEGTAQLGPMSRQMKSSELDRFEQEFGYKPTPVKVAIDALVVFVHKDNPVEGLTLQQVDSLFSSTYKRGGTDLAVWGNAGLTGDWGARPVSLYGRNSASGTYGFFKSVALKKGDYKDTVERTARFLLRGAGRGQRSGRRRLLRYWLQDLQRARAAAGRSGPDVRADPGKLPERRLPAGAFPVYLRQQEARRRA